MLLTEFSGCLSSQSIHRLVLFVGPFEHETSSVQMGTVTQGFERILQTRKSKNRRWFETRDSLPWHHFCSWSPRNQNHGDVHRRSFSAFERISVHQTRETVRVILWHWLETEYSSRGFYLFVVPFRSVVFASLNSLTDCEWKNRQYECFSLFLEEMEFTSTLWSAPIVSIRVYDLVDRWVASVSELRRVISTTRTQQNHNPWITIDLDVWDLSFSPRRHDKVR